jgi:Protein of unknown function (DUF3147)
MDIVIRFFVGGLVVAAFAVAGDILKPKSFAGLFGAAPSVALASLGLTIAKDGANYASIECRSMLAGAVALAVYSALVCVLLARTRTGPLAASTVSMLAWFAVSFGSWFVFLR